MNATYYASKKILGQIGEESPTSIMWLFSSIDRLLKCKKEMSLKEFYQELQELYPVEYEQIKHVKEKKGFKII
jgi:hypothetical protein